jgi:catalase
VVVPGGKDAIVKLGNVGNALEFLKDQYRHAKPILALAEGADLVENAGIPLVLPSGSPDPGLLLQPEGDAQAILSEFIDAVGRHRHHAREQDPPAV